MRPTRFKVESLKAILCFNTEGEFTNDYYAVVVNESFNGSCLVSRNDEAITMDQIFRVKVGELSEMQATVRWIKELDEDVIKFGIEYKE